MKKYLSLWFIILLCPILAMAGEEPQQCAENIADAEIAEMFAVLQDLNL